MKKEYLMDGKIVRRCEFNISKMNILEYMYYHVFHWNQIGNLVVNYIFVSLIESVKYMGAFFFNLLLLIGTPVILPCTAYIEIKNAKEVCNQHKKER